MRFEEGLGRAIDPLIVSDAPCQEVVRLGSEVDLTAIPFPIIYVLDGGPYISATMVTSKDPDFGGNVGSYRLMYRTPTETEIDLVSPSDMRFYYQRALDKGRPSTSRLQLACIPTKCWLLRSRHRTIRTIAIAGGLHQEPIPLVKCKTVDLEVPADAEIVLEEKSFRLAGPPMKVRLGNSVKFPGMSSGTRYFGLSVSLIARTRSSIFCKCLGKTIGYARL